MNYIELNIALSPFSPWNEIVVSQLAEIGFESFTETDHAVQAYIQEELYNNEHVEQILHSIGQQISIVTKTTLIEHQNWNAAWEADFKPVDVDERLIIRAPFHARSQTIDREIIIQPQMSFGTGHHHTTWLLSKTLLDIDFNNKRVLDVGTGTGVLAIQAAQQGAQFIVGTDIEDEVCQNAKENCERNGMPHIEIILGDLDQVTSADFDIIIANINKNVLKRHMPLYSKLIKSGGLLFLSGFFHTDVEEIIDHAAHFDLKDAKFESKETWAVIRLVKH